MVAQPQSPYAVTKLAGEHFCRVFARTYGLPTACLRYFNVYGPRQDPNSTYAAVIPRFIASCLANSSATIYGDGTQSRDFTFVADCIAANLLACESNVKDGEYCNIGTGASVSIQMLHEKIRQLVGSGQPPQFQAQREGDVKHSQADIAKAASLLGYGPRYTIDDGLRTTIDWFKRSHTDDQQDRSVFDSA
jgi:nucleoside-diphosphate-sugar epimerase